jgi:phosphoglycolate phosphatase-like HAD superfamily hydrolase
LSETEWVHERPVPNGFNSRATRALAFALQDADEAVDVVNEAMLLEKLPQYRAVFVANQDHLAPAVESALARFAERGGKLVNLSGAKIAEPDRAG